MKLSISNIAWAAQADDEVYRLMKEKGYRGLEIAPTRIFPDKPYTLLREAAAWAEALKQEHGFTIPSMQSIWFGRRERLFGSVQERAALAEYTRFAVDFAAAAGCGNLVFGSPKNRALPESADAQLRRQGIEFFREIGDYAAENGTVIGMEANPAIYNTNYINTTAEALALIRETGSAGLLLNLDSGAMIQNAEAVETLEGAAGYIHHVHISEPYLAPIVTSAQRRSFHRELACFLRENGYNGYVSIEMGRVEELSVLEETLGYVKEIFG
ncbi:MAG: sugar phosphate isomerase/epimerase [Roseburia sp.]|nr:sugar phosphate isomerase/epimerase [Roseburia sp.]